MQFLPKKTTERSTLRLQRKEHCRLRRQIQTSQSREIGAPVDLMLGIDITVPCGGVRRKQGALEITSWSI